MNFFISLLTAMLFFSYAVDNRLMSILIIILIIIGLFKKQKFKFYKRNICTLFCGLIAIIAYLYSPDLNYSLTYLLLFISSLVFEVCLSNYDKWIKWFLKTAFVCSSIHVIATIIQRISPQSIDYINKILLNPDQYRANSYMLRNGGYAGITGQIGANSFYIAIFIILILSSLFQKKKRIFKLLLLFLGITALVLTNKLGPLIFIVLSMGITTYIYYYYRSKIVKSKSAIILLTSFLIVFIIGLFSYTLLQNEYEFSFETLNEISTGRIDIYKNMFEHIKRSFVIGNGLLSVPYYLNIFGHNIYLQILCEYGIFGFLVYMYAFSYKFFDFLKNYKHFLKKDSNSSEFFISCSCMMFMIFALLYGLTGNVIYDGFSLVILILFFACGNVLSKKRGEKIEK